MLRRAVVVATGFALSASVGIGGAGAASVASPAGVKEGSNWTIEINNQEDPRGCEVLTFSASDHTFAGDWGDFGSWNVPAPNKVKIKIAQGPHGGAIFKGTYSPTSHKTYVGKERLGTAVYTGQLVKGVVSSFNGKPC